ncbi:mitochondrial ATP-independent inner membrane protease subunit 1a-like [Aristolochia californica]|uniref:mitochondrial ATP-independent inner membrane protease subunit 1a-like n=1 Tax=Aristolochia californica TaxID=171875 RepID=UPI0035DF7DB2
MNALRNFACRFRSIPHLANAKEAMGKALIFVKFGCFLHITNNYLGTIALVYGPSMLPTLNLTGDIVFVERISTRFGAAGVGDVVLARSPQNPKRLLTKRITAMEGDIVTFATDPMKNGGCRTVVVPKGHVWIQGDNALQSNDSRHFGAIPYGLLQGKVVCRVWPLDGFGSLV